MSERSKAVQCSILGWFEEEPLSLMKYLLLLMTIVVAHASTLCNDPSLAGADVNPNGNTVSITCGVGPLTFQNFAYTNNGNDSSPAVDLVNPQPASLPNDWVIGLNPNLIGDGTQDVLFAFEVVSSIPINGVGLFDSGSVPPSGIGEHVCDSSGVNFSTGACNGALLASFGANDMNPSISASIAPSTDIWVWKDIDVGNDGHLSAFEQSYSTSVPTLPRTATSPEPTTMLLTAAGLLALGWRWRRRS